MNRSRLGYLLLAVGLIGITFGYLILPFFTSKIITIESFEFHPDTTTIVRGTKVIWLNYDVEPHDVISGVPGMRDNQYKSPLLGPGGTLSFVFEEPGEYRYFCGLHPYMTGRIIVTPELEDLIRTGHE